jgi:hypothetical protein
MRSKYANTYFFATKPVISILDFLDYPIKKVILTVICFE